MARVGLLPFYMVLYDERSPERRKAVESFRDTIKGELEAETWRSLPHLSAG